MGLTLDLSLLAVKLCREREFSNVLRALRYIKSTTELENISFSWSKFPGNGVSDYRRCFC